MNIDMSNDNHTQMLANENVLLSDKLALEKALTHEYEIRYEKLKNAFNDLLDIHVELRTKVGIDINDDFTYEWTERAGLIDSEL
jgi:hypothetical protein